jgi:16S rRNA processing protein RimM
MNLKEFYTIGYISRVIGLKGELGIKLDVDDPKRYHGIDALVLSDKNTADLHELSRAQVRGEELVIILKGITDRDIAKTFVGKTVMLPLTALPELGEKEFYYHEIAGYTVIDTEHGELGPAKDVMERPPQPVLIIKYGYDEILIPLTKDIIQKVDREKKELHVKAPEGLIDLYLKKDEEEE